MYYKMGNAVKFPINIATRYKDTKILPVHVPCNDFLNSYYKINQSSDGTIVEVTNMVLLLFSCTIANKS